MLEQVSGITCGLWRTMLEKSVPERHYSVERSHAGVVHEEQQPLGEGPHSGTEEEWKIPQDNMSMTHYG